MSGANGGQATVFLDRDGVINRRIVDGYVRDLSEFEILPGVPAALAALSEAGFRLAVVTNQRGIALGRMTAATVAEVHRELSSRLARAGGALREFYVCPHDREDGCACRKPRPGLLDQAHAVAPVAWAASYLIGDSDSDIEAGRARGVTTIKVAGPSRAGANHEAADLPAAVAWLLNRE